MSISKANAVVDDLVSLAMEEGLERCLVELAKSHENKTGTWLSTIETDVMATLKGQLAARAGIDWPHRQWQRRRNRWRRSSRSSATASKRNN